MNKIEFVNKTVGTQYVNRGCDYDGVDCFGLVYLYFRDVLGVVSELSDEYLNDKPFNVAFQAQLDLGQWVKIDDPQGGEVVFMLYDNNDLPTHCGVMIDNKTCLHAHGNDSIGQVVLWDIKKVKRYIQRIHGIETTPHMEFYKWQS